MPDQEARLPPPLAQFCARVNARLRDLVRELPEPLRGPAGALAGHPGKCLRSALLGACSGCAAPAGPRLVRLGALVELLHMASLLHDDVIDRAATRRGLPAAHTLIGNEGAMLAGLACFALAGMEAADIGGAVPRLVSATVASLAQGEMLDVERAFDTSLAVPDYLELIRRKTADLFRLCCLLGATGAEPETPGSGPPAAALAEFGAEFGLAFQIRDDCLDLQPADSGKPGGTDHLLGLFGAPTLHALAADPTGELRALLLSPTFSEADLPAVRRLVSAHGGFDSAAALAGQHRRRALARLDGVAAQTREMLLAVTAAAWAGRP